MYQSQKNHLKKEHSIMQSRSIVLKMTRQNITFASEKHLIDLRNDNKVKILIRPWQSSANCNL